jgi:hypothetical protein
MAKSIATRILKVDYDFIKARKLNMSQVIKQSLTHAHSIADADADADELVQVTFYAGTAATRLQAIIDELSERLVIPKQHVVQRAVHSFIQHYKGR